MGQDRPRVPAACPVVPVSELRATEARDGAVTTAQPAPMEPGSRAGLHPAIWLCGR